MDNRRIVVAMFIYTLIQVSDQYENLALGKTVTVSQRYNDKDFDPSNAVDGNDSMDLLNCSLTASGQKEAWLTVELGKKKDIASISFLHGGLGVNANPIDSTTSGIYRRGTSTIVQTETNNRGWLCHDFFTANDAQVVCLIWGFLPENADISSSPNAQNSFAKCNYECIGNETSIHDCPKNNEICPITKSGTNLFRNRTKLTCKEGDTLSGFSVFVSDTDDWKSGTLCYQHRLEKPLNNTVNIDCFTSGRYVTIYNSRNNTDVSSLSEFAYINICELNITGCDAGFYGENCTKCSDNCLNDTCQFQTGHCFECKDGFKSEMCEEGCPLGRFVGNCSIQCGNCLDQLSCDHISGVCHGGCSSGWTGYHCDQASFDIVSLLIATTTILSVLVVGYTLYKLKQKYVASRQTSKQNYDMSEILNIDRKYETIQEKKEADKVDDKKTGEYMEIAAISSEYMNLNLK